MEIWPMSGKKGRGKAFIQAQKQVRLLTCNRCQRTKRAEEFVTWRRWCKECWRLYFRDYRDRHRVELRGYWRARKQEEGNQA